VTGVTLADGRALAGDVVVLAAGAWTPAIGGVPRELPVRPVRGQMLRFPYGPPLRRLLATHTGRYIVPRNDGSILAGSTMEEAGFDRSITEEGRRAILASCRALVPALWLDPFGSLTKNLVILPAILAMMALEEGRRNG